MNFLVTGCSRGVGLEICRALLQQGHIVYGVARSYTNEFKFLETEYAGRVFFKSIDLSDSEMYARQFLENLYTTASSFMDM